MLLKPKITSFHLQKNNKKNNLFFVMNKNKQTNHAPMLKLCNAAALRRM